MNTRLSPRDILLSLADEAFHRRSWHGTTRRGARRGLDAAQAAWRPPRGGDSPAALIRGIAAHDLYHAGQVELLERLRAGRTSR